MPLFRQSHQEELQASQTRGVPKGPQPLGDSSGANRPRRQSAPATAGPPQIKTNGSPRMSDESSIDEAFVAKSITNPGELYILEVYEASETVTRFLL